MRYRLLSKGYLCLACGGVYYFNPLNSGQASPGIRVYIEGTLQKRQRGKKKHRHISLKFQERFFQLTLVSLKYYEKQPTCDADQPNGSFTVSSIKIVEMVPDNVFGKMFVFQIGDQDELMYLVAASDEERTTWMQRFREVAADNGNMMLSRYHSGVFSRRVSATWSCCKSREQTACGCQSITAAQSPVMTTNESAGFHLSSPVHNPILESCDSDKTTTCSSNHENNVPTANTELSPNQFEPSSQTNEAPYDFRSRSSTMATTDSGRGTIASAISEQCLTPAQSVCTLTSPPKGRKHHKSSQSMQCGEGQWASVSEISGTEETDRVDYCPPVSHVQEQTHRDESDRAFEYEKTSPLTPDSGTLPPEIAALFDACAGECKDFEKLSDLLGDISDVNSEYRPLRTTMLHKACKRGMTGIVKMFLHNHVDVNQADRLMGRTPLHEAALVGHTDVLQLLLEEGADPLARDDNDKTPYDLAFKGNYYEAMDILCKVMPATVRPYHPLQEHSSLTNDSIPALVFPDSTTLIAGLSDSIAQVWEVPALSLQGTIRTAGATSSLSVWRNFLAIGSNIIQVVDLSVERVRRIFIADEEPVQNLPMHFVAFGPEGHLTTVNCESKTVKVWPPPSQAQEFITDPVWSSGLNALQGSISSLSASKNAEHPWLAVGESMVSGLGGRVHLLNWKSSEEESYSVLHASEVTDAKGVSDMHTGFSYSGQYLATGCKRRLVIWEALSGKFNVIYELPVHIENCFISSLCYSPNDAHLAVGMSTGDVVVYEASSGGPIFTLENQKDITSAVAALAYSSHTSHCAAAYKNGCIQLWQTFKASDDALIARSEANDYKMLSKPQKVSKPSVLREMPLLGYTEHTIENRKEEYSISFLDYKLVIPPRATPEGRNISFQTGETHYGPVGPFKFPDNTRPVSSVVWFCSDEMSELEKPIKFVLSHCYKCSGEDDLPKLAFAKASDEEVTVNQRGEKEFTFHIVTEEEKEEEPIFTAKDGTLVTRHTCFYCIVERISREDIDHASYCLTEAVSLQAYEGVHDIRFILSYYLHPCIKTISYQYGRTHKLIHRQVTFSNQGANQSIKLAFEVNPSRDWTVVSKFSKSISIEKVRFHEKSMRELALDMRTNIYPPSVMLEASGREATCDAVLSVKISGTDEELESEILLKKPDPDTLASLVEDHVQGTVDTECLERLGLPECGDYYTEQGTVPVQCVGSQGSDSDVDSYHVQDMGSRHSCSPLEDRHPNVFVNQLALSGYTKDSYSTSHSTPTQNGAADVVPLQETNDNPHINGFIPQPVPHYKLDVNPKH